MLNRIHKAQASDTTKFNRITIACKIKKLTNKS